MWKHAIGYALAAFFGSALGIVGAATLPLFNPQQLQIPLTGLDFNNLIGQINANFLSAGAGGVSGIPGQPSGSFSVYQSGSINGSLTSVDGLQVIGAAANASGLPSPMVGM